MAAIKHLFHIAASKQKVYEAISTTEGLKNWWTLQVSGDGTPGGVLAFRFGAGGPDFKVTDVTANESVSWECVQGFPDWLGTTINIYLDENDGKTRVRFSHDNWKEVTDNYANCNFSWGRYLESLRQYCQTGAGTPFNGL